MKRRYWIKAIASVSGMLLLCTLTIVWLRYELDAWADATPQNIARRRTEYLLAMAQANPTGAIPTQFRTEGVDMRCWSFLQDAMAVPPRPTIHVAPNGTPVYGASVFREDDLVATITFNDGGMVRLLYLAGGIVDCTPESAGKTTLAIGLLHQQANNAL
jgi:hypothetical protein